MYQQQAIPIQTAAVAPPPAHSETANAGPAWHYACQAVAVDTFRQQSGSNDLKDYGASSEDQPPRPLHPPDLAAACASKREAIARYTAAPVKCAHCSAMIDPKHVVELRNGDVARYCRAPGGCSLSQFIFIMPSRSVARFEKAACTYTPNAEDLVTHPAQATVPRTNMPMMQRIGPEWLLDPACNASTPAADRRFLHCETRCAKCGVSLEDHVRGYDAHGWVMKGDTQVPLPADWPTWNPATSSWS
ncbi:hypothetical protein Pelo_17460 [Pelomyxa schiedti]|nr:hypothetical protein Pelo_17460 [Pelomyxa schiedti]